MRTKFSGFFSLLLVFLVQITFAQEKTITGNVTDQDGLPLPGVNVIVKGTTNGTQTDFDGNYSIRAREGETLLFTYIGQRNVERPIGTSNVINVRMEEDAQALEEVIVTSQGIKREKKALGYAVSTVGSENLEQKAEGDIGRVLNGQASGVQINATNGISGSATNIVIRGYTSISQGNQPLFIVDGVPFSADTNAQGSFVNGNNGSSRFIDIDPNNIESINVLKGLAAANLYGTAGRNGVILITTKNGATGGASKKIEITLNQSVFFTNIASMPEYQDSYGGGFDQAFGWFFSNWGPSFTNSGPEDFGSSFRGIAEDGTILISHPTQNNAAVAAAFPEYANATYAYQPYDNVRDFFRTGSVVNTSINAQGRSDDGKVSYGANFGHLEDKGFTPGNTLRRNTFGFGGRAELSNKFTISGTLNYTKTDFYSPPVAASQGNGAFGSGSSVFGHVFFTPRSIDLMGLPYQNPINGSTVYYRAGNDIQNPRWTVANAFGNQFTDRMFGNSTLTFRINDNLNVFWRSGLSFYTERNESGQNMGGAEGNINGDYATYDNKRTVWDHTFQINGNYYLTDDLDVSFNLGATSRRDILAQQGVSSTQQILFGFFDHSNFEEQSDIQYNSEQNILGAYAQAEFGYRSLFYLTLSGRNDWVSNFNPENRSIFYPSASVSFIPTAFDGFGSNEGLSFFKIRAGYGTSAGFAGGYPTFSSALLDGRDFQGPDGSNMPSITISDAAGNPDLRPEKVEEIEIGLETRFFSNRVGLDVSLYSKTTTDLITGRPLDPSTGFTSVSTNIGEVQVQGVEVDFNYNIIRNENFNWSLNSNFTADESLVVDLGNDTDNIGIAGFTSLGNFAVPGRPYGVIMGTRILRDENGNFVVNSTGSYAEEQGLFEIGDPNPDWRLNVSNTINYKGFSFFMLWSYRHGGDVYSNTVSALIGRGLVTDTEDRESTFVLPGVRQDGSPNTIQVNNSDFYFNNVAFGPDELQLYDGSVLRLREVALGYTLPRKFLDSTPFGNISITLSAQNLWFEGFGVPDSTNFDPESLGVGVGNGLGLEFLNGPSSKRYGVSVKATF